MVPGEILKYFLDIRVSQMGSNVLPITIISSGIVILVTHLLLIMSVKMSDISQEVITYLNTKEKCCYVYFEV